MDQVFVQVIVSIHQDLTCAHVLMAGDLWVMDGPVEVGTCLSSNITYNIGSYSN